MIGAHCVTRAVSRTDVTLLLTYCVMPSDGAAELCGPWLILSISAIAIQVCSARLLYVKTYCTNSIQCYFIITVHNGARMVHSHCCPYVVHWGCIHIIKPIHVHVRTAGLLLLRARAGANYCSQLS